MRVKLYISVYSWIWWHARSTSYLIVVYPIETMGFCRISWILAALKRIGMTFPWKTAGMPVSNFSSRAFRDQRMKDCLKTNLLGSWLFFEDSSMIFRLCLMSSAANGNAPAFCCIAIWTIFASDLSSEEAYSKAKRWYYTQIVTCAHRNTWPLPHDFHP